MEGETENGRKGILVYLLLILSSILLIAIFFYGILLIIASVIIVSVLIAFKFKKHEKEIKILKGILTAIQELVTKELEKKENE